MFTLLKKLCSNHAPSGNEGTMQEFLLSYINENKSSWKTQPEIIFGDEFQHCIILIFGKPRTACFAHMDNIGFTVRYENELVKIGGPQIMNGYTLTGEDALGIVECTLNINTKNELSYDFYRTIETGTDLSFKMNWREDKDFVQSCYMDNRVGVLNALMLCSTIDNGAIVFSCWEEHGGGSVPYLAKYLYEKYKIKQALISDITWITEGVQHGKGVVVSMRDSGLPRRVFVNRVMQCLTKNNIVYQREVESSGGSDGNELQKQPYPIDWCFVGAAESFVHSPDEKVHKKDIDSMINAYNILMKEL